MSIAMLSVESNHHLNTMSGGGNTTPSPFQPHFSSADGDVVLCSHEGTLFRAHSYALRATSGLFKTIFDLPNVYGDESRLGVARRSEEETVQLGTSELALLSLIRPRRFLTYNGPNDSCIRCVYVELDSSSWDVPHAHHDSRIRTQTVGRHSPRHGDSCRLEHRGRPTRNLFDINAPTVNFLI